jgi:hypothetical protein
MQRLIYFLSLLVRRSGINLDMDISDRDTLFREAAEIIVNAQEFCFVVTTKTKIRLQQSRPID